MAQESVSVIRRQYAVKGAETRLAALETEVAAIRRAFPELVTIEVVNRLAAPAKAVKDGRSKKRTAAQRKAVSLRMKAYWAKRRKAARREQTTTVSGKKASTQPKD